MINELFEKLYEQIINKEPERAFFVKKLFKETWIDWNFLENKLNDFYHLDPGKIELINKKKVKYYPSVIQVPWSRKEVIDVGEIFNALEKKHSLIILGASKFHPQINEMCAALEKQNPNSAADVHIYCGNEKSKSFEIHFDYADNFIVQQTGTSKWKVYNQYALEDEKSSRIIKNEKNLTLDFECVLEPGDMIYVPKKRFHYAEPLERRISLSFAVMSASSSIKRKWYKFK